MSVDNGVDLTFMRYLEVMLFESVQWIPQVKTTNSFDALMECTPTNMQYAL